MTGREDNGRFAKGVSGNPKGRSPKKREEKFYEITLNSVTYADWKEIIEKAVAQAKRGDAVARKFLADYLIGPPVTKNEITGKDGGPIRQELTVNDGAIIRKLLPELAGGGAEAAPGQAE